LRPANLVLVSLVAYEDSKLTKGATMPPVPPELDEDDDDDDTLQPVGPIPAEFFEKWALYRKYSWQAPRNYMYLVKEWPTINMHCDECGRNETFVTLDFKVDPITVKGRGPMGGAVSSVPPAGHTTAIWYICVGCKKTEYAFVFRVSEDSKQLQKVGQHPPWSIEVEKPVAEALGKFIEWYKKGVCVHASSHLN
jgi:hypothetical protein